jgi:hypothetical protein
VRRRRLGFPGQRWVPGQVRVLSEDLDEEDPGKNGSCDGVIGTNTHLIPNNMTKWDFSVVTLVLDYVKSLL